VLDRETLIIILNLLPRATLSPSEIQAYLQAETQVREALKTLDSEEK
jgi:hypothetical protein